MHGFNAAAPVNAWLSMSMFDCRVVVPCWMHRLLTRACSRLLKLQTASKGGYDCIHMAALPPDSSVGMVVNLELAL